MKQHFTKFGLNEMAFKNPKTMRPYQNGDIVGIRTLKNTGYKPRASWKAWSPPREDIEDEVQYYMTINGNASRYVFGEILAWNVGDQLTSPSNNLQLRVNGAEIEIPGAEWKYIEPKLEEVKDLVDSKSWYAFGKEKIFMDENGHEIPVKNEIRLRGTDFNFLLTRKFKEPVIGFVNNRKFVFVKFSDIKNLPVELSDTQRKSLTDWLWKEHEINVVIDDENYFKFVEYKITKGTGYYKDWIPSVRSKKIMEKFLKDLKSLPYLKNATLEISKTYTGSMSYKDFIANLKSVYDIEFDIDEIMGSKKTKMNNLKNSMF